MRFSVDEPITHKVVGGVLDLETNQPIDGVIFADDISGILHRYDFDEEGKLALNENGEPKVVVESRNFRFLRRLPEEN